ncbi:MAG TPA: hypothetical protein VMU99_10370 [Acidimicrobiales bacterium]|nr:hypothetical protein [Acidimicrobiales bacterium]
MPKGELSHVLRYPSVLRLEFDGLTAGSLARSATKERPERRYNVAHVRIFVIKSYPKIIRFQISVGPWYLQLIGNRYMLSVIDMTLLTIGAT